jgi:hypothetical protein
MEQPHQIAEAQEVAAMLEEYRALYSLLVFRLGALEQRLATALAAFVAALGAATVMPAPARLLVFVGLPLGLGWYVRSTVGHARAKQDVKLRIAEIEESVNALIGADAITFQSRHPSRGTVAAGRTGRELVMSVYLGSLALLAAGVRLFPLAEPTARAAFLYTVYSASCGLWMSLEVLRLARYRDARRVIRTEQT